MYFLVCSTITRLDDEYLSLLNTDATRAFGSVIPYACSLICSWVMLFPRLRVPVFLFYRNLSVFVRCDLAHPVCSRAFLKIGGIGPAPPTIHAILVVRV